LSSSKENIKFLEKNWLFLHGFNKFLITFPHINPALRRALRRRSSSV
jgi:hypothetical protein